MKKIWIISLLIFCRTNVSGQSFDFGIQYIPLQASLLSFDQDYLIFDDLTSLRVNDVSPGVGAPSLSNTGLFLRYKSLGHYCPDWF